MSEFCEFQMKIVGTRENCERWWRCMNVPHLTESNRHIWAEEANRIYGIYADVDEEGGTDDNHYIILDGTCKRSLRHVSGDPIKDLFAANTREFSLQMEAWTGIPTYDDLEHCVYDKGKCLQWEEVDWKFGEDSEDYCTYQI